ncbi:diguanylate cyclase [Haloimpatiens sp. FM7330]|uniref:sensor domain-containing diguanylate cyclase n=1 Tax=Haloimpatiens sp. FM7330 TaxID=3298610 RepID=UPI0036328033
MNKLFIVYLGLFLAVIVLLIQFIIICSLRSRLKKLENIKKHILNLSQEVINTDNKEAVYNMMLKSAIDLIENGDKGSILILESDGKFHYKSVLGYSDEIKKVTFYKKEVYLYNLSNFKKTSIIINPYKFDKNVLHKQSKFILEKHNAFDIKATLSSPIYLQNKLVGIINVDCTNPSKNFSSEDIKLINLIKGELQIILENFFVKKRLIKMSYMDELTGIYNRRRIKKEITQYLKIKENKNKDLYFVMIDIDNFKKINDNFGHKAGDDALKLVSDIFKESLNKDVIYGRMSGDEFLIIFFNTYLQEVEKNIDYIKSKIKQTQVGKFDLTFSYGINKINGQKCKKISDIIDLADKNMYLNKKNKNKLS